ncbi:hypothetical protein C8T65DRAFT_241168 [Cerioporus squamosus]|nr:hypothetical protein C8T65DRAFT_241168 [Cerioporus squamosus]
MAERAAQRYPSTRTALRPADPYAHHHGPARTRAARYALRLLSLRARHHGTWPTSGCRSVASYMGCPRDSNNAHDTGDVPQPELQVQVNVHDYMEHLKRMTDGVLSAQVKDRYREFSHSIRQYSFVRFCRRQGVTPSRGLPPRALAAECPGLSPANVNTGRALGAREALLACGRPPSYF